jgi:hypothetical protein
MHRLSDSHPLASFQPPPTTASNSATPSTTSTSTSAPAQAPVKVVPSTTPSEVSTWFCQACTFENNAVDKRCIICRTERGATFTADNQQLESTNLPVQQDRQAPNNTDSSDFELLPYVELPDSDVAYNPHDIIAVSSYHFESSSTTVVDFISLRRVSRRVNLNFSKPVLVLQVAICRLCNSLCEVIARAPLEQSQVWDDRATI